MAEGVHVEVAISDTHVCQVAPHSEEGDARVTSVTKTLDPVDSGQLTEEFTLVGNENSPETDGGQALTGTTSETLFRTRQKEVHRFKRDTPQHCVCERIESHGCPVRDVEAVDGTLYATFVAPDHDTLRTLLEELANVYDTLSICRLLQDEDECGTQQRRILDAGALTDRQYEVLSTAHELGYFSHPRETDAKTVADELGIAASTFTEHLAAAQRNLLDEFLNS